MKEEVLDRRREMLSLHKQGMKICEWAPLVASKYQITEDAAKRDWSHDEAGYTIS